MQLHCSYSTSTPQHSLHSRTMLNLETILGKFLRDIRRTFCRSNPFNMCFFLCIISRRFSFTTFFKFGNRRFIFPSILHHKYVPNIRMGDIPHLRFFLQCSISCLASNAIPSMLVVRPSFFAYRRGVECPQILSIVLELLHLVSSYVESFREQLYRKSLTAHGNEMGPVKRG
jgi:hypothetical protein